jgi:predicted adenylyl cyclase CyaB
MPKSLEFKAKCKSLEILRDTIVSKGAELIGSKDQDDMIFLVPGSKAGLKLREQSPGPCQLISWERAEVKGPKSCQYLVAPVSDPEATRQVLSAVLQVHGRVIKRREVFRYKGVTVQLDSVKGLGEFIECEAPLEQMTEKRAKEVLDEIIRILEIPPQSMIDRSYVELLSGNN